MLSYVYVPLQVHMPATHGVIGTTVVLIEEDQGRDCIILQVQGKASCLPVGCHVQMIHFLLCLP